MKKNFEKRIKKEWKNIIFNILFGVVSLLIVILFFENILLTTLLLGVVAIIGQIKWKSRLTLFVFFFFGILFGISEIIVSDYSVWEYSVSNLQNIPTWLFILWGNTAAFMQQSIKEIRKLGIKK
ncbi:hypothetical protein HOG16_03380 [Candidatus Woesearchaeota archaeon]|jgi:hypothetical protein|nr:hypothetical protein [Candidatus Woesearchaeota archaeon]MBT4321567.1 hypothetical protein [Candidatus Woesearchaeota archaeon]MBT4631122.1 hypothetical protein [Candidatus Woesearchaeota archaeon]